MKLVRNIRLDKTIQVDDKDVYALRVKTLNRSILTALKRKAAKKIKELVSMVNVNDENTNLN